MKEYFKELYDILVGKPCCYIKIGYGSNFRIGAGEKIYYKNPKLHGKFHGEWDIICRSYAWRIIKNGKFLCGSDDEIEDIEEIIETLNLGVFTKIERERKAGIDFSLHFEDGIIVDYFCCSTNDNQMMIMQKDGIAYELTVEGIYKVYTNEHFQTLTEIESFISEYSEKCSARWEAKVPDKDYPKKCGDCFYLRGIDGHFHFWDYGICSNFNSIYDGTLVSIKSGCEFNEQLKNLHSEVKI